MNWISALTPLQWALISLAPPAIVALYFLKLKRHPLEVPSTYLWTRAIEDLHVNSIWQRLRQSLLLFLQLAVLLLAILACLRPGWRGTEFVNDRLIFMIDASASMNATDVGPTRLDEAKRRAIALIEQMKDSHVGMVISFSDVARVEQSFTNSRAELRKAVNRIRPTRRSTDMSEALRAAAGLANPGRISQEGTNDVQVADAMPASLYIFSDGGAAEEPDFSLGNLQPVFVPIGMPDAKNVGVVAFYADRNAEKPGQMQAFARLENSSADEQTVEVTLYLNDTLVDASQVTAPAGEAQGVTFAMQDVDQGVLKLEVRHPDDLDIDNIVYAAINTPRRARVLVVTPGNDALRLALTTDAALTIAEVAFATPDVLETKEHQELAMVGAYDLIVYDRCAPGEMPQANTMFIGVAPPAPGWTAQGVWSAEQENRWPLVVDSDRLHPLMNMLEFSAFMRVAEVTKFQAPEGATSLLDTDVGSLITIAPRQGFEDVLMAFELVGKYPTGEVNAKSDWPKLRSFPLFVMNALSYLGGARGALSVSSAQPGHPLTVRTEAPAARITIESPSGKKTVVEREGRNAFVYTQTEELGVYRVIEGDTGDTGRHFAVNLFDGRESDLTPREALGISHDKIEGVAGAAEVARKELWKWLLGAALVVLVFEWYVYNRRVYF